MESISADGARTVLEPIEPYLRSGEELNPLADVVVRGWPLTVEGILQYADDARNRFSWGDEPFVAVSSEATVGGRTLDELLAGPTLADPQALRQHRGAAAPRGRVPSAPELRRTALQHRAQGLF